MEQSHDRKEKDVSRLSKVIRAIRRFMDYPGDLTSGVTPALLERRGRGREDRKD